MEISGPEALDYRDGGYCFDFTCSKSELESDMLPRLGGVMTTGHQPWRLQRGFRRLPGKHTVAVSLDNQYTGEARITVLSDGSVKPELVKIVVGPKPGTVSSRPSFRFDYPRELRDATVSYRLVLLRLTREGNETSDSVYCSTNGLPRDLTAPLRIRPGRHNVLCMVGSDYVWIGKAHLTVLPDGSVDPPVVMVSFEKRMR